MTNGDAADNVPPNNGGGAATADVVPEEDPRALEFKQRYHLAESRLMGLFRTKETRSDGVGGESLRSEGANQEGADAADASSAPPKKPARAIDEDDYGDEDDDEEEAEAPALSLPKPGPSIRARQSPVTPIPAQFGKPPLDRTTSTDPGKSSDDARKQAEEDKEAAEDAAKQNFHTYFYTLENDRIAMLEQQKLDELDRLVEAETLGQQVNDSAAAASAPQQGSLSSSNLGASSLMLKHLLQRIDSKRNMVSANDAQLRRLISEVRKNRSKWASEDKVNQEELYEAAEKVLQDLKALTEWSGPFLQRVSKREAPDYYNFIKNPMDIGTMMKKLKTFQYKSRQEIVDDLHLIWNNCLKYNTDPNHFLRKKALYMQKQTDKLVIHIPDLTVRDRAEVEAEERRNASLDAELDGMEDSEDGMLNLDVGSGWTVTNFTQKSPLWRRAGGKPPAKVTRVAPMLGKLPQLWKAHRGQRRSLRCIR